MRFHLNWSGISSCQKSDSEFDEHHLGLDLAGGVLRRCEFSQVADPLRVELQLREIITAAQDISVDQRLGVAVVARRRNLGAADSELQGAGAPADSRI